MNSAIQIVKSCILIITALFPIVNPLGNSPIFLGLTSGYSSAMRMLLSRKIALNSFILLLVSMLIGTHILAFFGISLPVVQVAGGLVVMATGWTMLHRPDEISTKSSATAHDITPQDLSRRAFYPLTLPLTVGPGSISVAITLGANEPHSYTGANVVTLIIPVLVGSAVVALCVYLCYRFADRLAQFLGDTAMSVILRLSSFILLCIGVQIIWNGVSALFRSISAPAI